MHEALASMHSVYQGMFPRALVVVSKICIGEQQGYKGECLYKCLVGLYNYRLACVWY